MRSKLADPARRRLALSVLVAAGLAHLPLLLPAPLWLQAAAVLLLAGLLPGVMLVELLIDQSRPRLEPVERAVLSVGAGYSTIVILLLVISYLPGGLARGQLIFASDLLILVLGARWWFIKQKQPTAVELPLYATQPANAPGGWSTTLLLFSVLLVGGFLRLTNLGYAEFQGDEARLALRAAEVIQGYENALFVHKKGPTEILLPTAVYVAGDRLDEVAARLPFALASIAGLVATFCLGRRLFGPLAGWAAAMLLAVDGYLIAFGRVVQYQSIVFLMDVLVVLLFVRLWQAPKHLGRQLTLAAILLATGLLSHYEAALVLFPVIYLLWRIWREGTPLGVLVRAAIGPLLVGGAILALFYAPFIRNPAFLDTYYYLTDYRMGGGRIFNHLVEFFARTTVYNSTYYLLMLILVTLAGLFTLYRRSNPRWLGWLLIGLVIAGFALMLLRPAWWISGGMDWTWLFFAAALVTGWLMPGAPVERMVWLWFGGPLILALFFTAIPNTHVYGFFIPWALLVGKLLADGWHWLRNRMEPRRAVLVGAALAAALVLLFGVYEYWLFVYNRSEVLRTWPEHRPVGYWTVYDMPVEVAIFGFPLNNGWKVVGSLYAEGVLQGNYDTNARDVVAEWYTRGEHYCARDDLKYYILASPVEPTLADETATIRSAVEQEHQLYGTVFVQGNPALSIYQRTEERLTPQRFDLADYANGFDRELTGPEVRRAGPVGDPAIQQPVNYRFGEAIRLKGYHLDANTVRPGDPLAVTLYWSTSAPLSQDYTVFVQVIDLNDLAKAGQSDGQPGCHRYPTTTWLPGDTIADPYRVTIDPTARPGPYALLIGLYTDAGRLEVFDAAGQPLGQQLALTQVDVQPNPPE